LVKGELKTIKKPSISRGERMRSSSRPQPASDATRCEGRGKQDVPSKGLSRASYDGMYGGKGRRVEERGGRKVRISQRLVYKPEIRPYYTLRNNLHIYINRRSA
jgi:hypothetical protein